MAVTGNSQEIVEAVNASTEPDNQSLQGTQSERRGAKATPRYGEPRLHAVSAIPRFGRMRAPSCAAQMQSLELHAATPDMFGIDNHVLQFLAQFAATYPDARGSLVNDVFSCLR